MQSLQCFCTHVQGGFALVLTFSPAFSFPKLEAISHFPTTFTNGWVIGFKDNEVHTCFVIMHAVGKLGAS